MSKVCEQAQARPGCLFSDRSTSYLFRRKRPDGPTGRPWCPRADCLLSAIRAMMTSPGNCLFKSYFPMGLQQRSISLVTVAVLITCDLYTCLGSYMYKCWSDFSVFQHFQKHSLPIIASANKLPSSPPSNHNNHEVFHSDLACFRWISRSCVICQTGLQ